MTFTYSVCFPDKEEIQTAHTPITGEDVLEIAMNYPWMEQLNILTSLERDELFYNPSLEFTCIENGQSFTLTANFDENKNAEFSLWYLRPKALKNMQGDAEKMTLDEVWSVKFNDAINYLDCFVKGNYKKIEGLYVI